MLPTFLILPLMLLLRRKMLARQLFYFADARRRHILFYDIMRFITNTIRRMTIYACFAIRRWYYFIRYMLAAPLLDAMLYRFYCRCRRRCLKIFRLLLCQRHFSYDVSPG